MLRFLLGALADVLTESALALRALVRVSEPRKEPAELDEPDDGVTVAQDPMNDAARAMIASEAPSRPKPQPEPPLVGSLAERYARSRRSF
jgi:hypothetical protein